VWRWLRCGSTRVARGVGSDFPLTSRSHNAKPYQQRARMRPASADGHGRPPSPQVDRREVRPHICTWRAGARVRTRGGGTSIVVVGLDGHGPLAPPPRLQVSPRPSCPYSLPPQHLTVASSCGERRARSAITRYGLHESLGRGRVLQVRWRGFRNEQLCAWVSMPPCLKSLSSSLPTRNLTSSAHVCVQRALTATAVLPAPRSTAGRLAPISAESGGRSEDKWGQGRYERHSGGAS